MHIAHGCFIAMACVAFADVTDTGVRRQKCLATALDNNGFRVNLLRSANVLEAQTQRYRIYDGRRSAAIPLTTCLGPRARFMTTLVPVLRLDFVPLQQAC